MASMYSFLISFPMTYHSMYESTNISNNTLVTKGIEAFNNFLTMRCRIQLSVRFYGGGKLQQKRFERFEQI